MVRFTATLAFAVLALAAPSPQLSPDPNGDDNIGNGQGLQFITGGCLSNDDCASGCCAGLASGEAVCSGPAVSFQQGKQGCGFNGSSGNTDNADVEDEEDQTSDDLFYVDTETGEKANAPGAENVGTGDGTQFITGPCVQDSDCASGCCAGRVGSDTAACSAVLVANDDGKTGCGFGS